MLFDEHSQTALHSFLSLWRISVSKLNVLQLQPMCF